MVRIARVGRMYKLVKLTRLLRVLKVAKNKNNLAKYILQYLHIGPAVESLVYFLLSFLLVLHIATCLWLIVGGLERGKMTTWMEGDEIMLYDDSLYN